MAGIKGWKKSNPITGFQSMWVSQRPDGVYKVLIQKTYWGKYYIHIENPNQKILKEVSSQDKARIYAMDYMRKNR